MKGLSDLIYKLRIPILILTILIVIPSVYVMKDLRIETDILNYLPEDYASVKAFNRIGEKYGGSYLAMVAIEFKDDVFTRKNLKRIRDLTESFKESPGVFSVMSLTNILDIRKVPDGLEVGKLIDKDDIPHTEEDLKKLKEYVLSKEMYKGALISGDSKVTLIVVRLNHETEKAVAAGALKKITMEGKGGENYYFGGIPFQIIQLKNIIFSDLKTLLPITTVVVMLVLLLGFRNKRGVIIPLITVLISVTLSVGLMALFEKPFTVISDFIPVILLVVGSAYAIHMLSHYYEHAHHGNNKEKVIKDAARSVTIPIIGAGVTTAVGFLSFYTSDISIIWQFGLFTAAGIFILMLLSITFVPSALSILPLKKSRVFGGTDEQSKEFRLTTVLSNFSISHPKAVVIIGAAVFIIAAASIPGISREVNYLHYFKEGVEIRKTENLMEEKFGGSIPLQILVKGDLKDPVVLREMTKIEKFLRTQKDVSLPQSTAYLVSEMNDVTNDAKKIPDSKYKVGNLWAFIEGNEVLDQLTDKKSREGLIQANISVVNTGEIKKIVKEVNRFLNKELEGRYYDVDITKADNPFKDIVFKEMAGAAALMISLDYKRIYNRKLKDKDELEETLLKLLRKRVKRISIFPDQKDKFIHELHSFMMSETFDMELSSGEEAKIAAGSIFELTMKEDVTKRKVEDVLRSRLLPETLEKDPEGPPYAAESVFIFIREFSENSFTERVYEKVKKIILVDSRDDINFLKLLRNDLLLLNDKFFPVKEKDMRGFNLQASKEADSGIRGPIHLTMQQSGIPIIYFEIDKQLVKSQVLSVLTALGFIFILMALQFRSLLIGAISVVPIIIAIAVNFAIMSYFKIPLDTATVMIASVAVGIGIDYIIHILNRYKYERKLGRGMQNALRRTIKTTGKAVFLNAFTVGIGFLVLIFANVVPMRYFGVLLAITMFSTSLASVTVIPALILVTRPRFIKSK